MFDKDKVQRDTKCYACFKVAKKSCNASCLCHVFKECNACVSYQTCKRLCHVTLALV